MYTDYKPCHRLPQTLRKTRPAPVHSAWVSRYRSDLQSPNRLLQALAIQTNELLEQCRENNAKLGITGMLLYKDCNFMQVLEGEESTVREIYAKIGSDPRHKAEILLQRGTQEERQFPGLSMGYRDLKSQDSRSNPHYNGFLNTPLPVSSSTEIPAARRNSCCPSRRTCRWKRRSTSATDNRQK